MDEHAPPPIANPQDKGEMWQAPVPGQKNWPMGPRYVAIYYSSRGRVRLRCWLKALALQPLKLLFCAYCLWGIYTIVHDGVDNFSSAFTIPLLIAFRHLWRVAGINHELLVFDGLKLWHFAPFDLYPFVWIDKFKVVTWGNDVLFVFLWRAYMIPRETFSSPAQGLELVDIARQLKRRRGISWQEEWNGRIYGVAPTAR